MKLFIPHLSCSFVSVHLISMRHELFPRRDVRGWGEFAAMTQKDVDLEVEMGSVSAAWGIWGQGGETDSACGGPEHRCATGLTSVCGITP